MRRDERMPITNQDDAMVADYEAPPPYRRRGPWKKQADAATNDTDRKNGERDCQQRDLSIGEYLECLGEVYRKYPSRGRR